MPLQIFARAGLVMLIAILAIFAVRNAVAAETEIPQIALTGSASISAAPDMALITTGVVSEAKTAAAALNENSDAMAKIIAAMKESGVEARDLQTSGFNVQPVYSHVKDNNGNRRIPRIEAYRVSNNLTIRVRDLENLGAILDKAVTLGSNQINGLTFDIAEKDDLLDKARADAVADALRRAKIMAEAAGVRLGKVLSMSETSYSPAPRPRMMREMAMDVAKAVPVEAGEVDLTVQVNMSWAIEQ